jgi:hypothetical protein
LPASEQTGAMAVDAVQLVLTDEETAASDAIEADHYPLSPRVHTRRAILNKIRSEPPREPRAASLAMSPARRPPVNKFTRGAFGEYKLHPRIYWQTIFICGKPRL